MKFCPAYISKTVRCSKLIVGKDIGCCRCATSWCDLDLTFDLVVLTMSFKILSGLMNSVGCRRLNLGGDIG